MLGRVPFIRAQTKNCSLAKIQETAEQVEPRDWAEDQPRESIFATRKGAIQIRLHAYLGGFDAHGPSLTLSKMSLEGQRASTMITEATRMYYDHRKCIYMCIYTYIYICICIL